jgi:hypothetical protein
LSEIKGGRTVIEIACSNDSLLGKVAHELKDCNHFRITQELDFTKKETVMYIADRARKKNVLLWVSFPCTGGSPWYHLNSKRPGGQAKLKKHLSLFYRLWANFGLLLDILKPNNPIIAIEWPRACSYWKFPCVVRVLQRFHLRFADFDGCYYGLTSVVNNMFIRIPWRIATNKTMFVKMCDQLPCNVKCIM